jgi:hypothetical protein
MQRALLWAMALSVATPAAQAQPSPPAAQNAFNPALSVILNGVYADLQRDPQTYHITGFVPTMGEVAPPPRGFSLGESELALSANIDPLFRGTLIAAIAPDDNSIGVEEGYIETTALPRGFTAKAGRFFSAVGYQNQQHPHAWDFTDAPLVLKAFLGGQLGEDGVQVRWLAPTDLYWDIGAELGRGRAFPASVPKGGKNGLGSLNLFTTVGGDLGESLAWQSGVSYFSTDPQDRTYEDPAGVTNAFTGTSRLWALSGVLKWSPRGNSTVRNFKLQGEYFHRDEEGQLTLDATGAALAGPYSSRQSGWYGQGVWQFMPQWRAGYRYDRLDSGSYVPTKHSVMVDWNPSEFSRVRLQLARDYSRMGEPDNQLFIQYIASLGAHGAHKF